MLFCASVQAQELAITITSAAGNVWVKEPASDVWSKTKVGQLLKEFDELKIDEGGIITVKFPDGSLISLKENTKITVAKLIKTKGEIHVELNLEEGALKAVVAKLKGKSSFKVKTPSAICGVRGTVFYLNVYKIVLPSGGSANKAITDLFVEIGAMDFKNFLSNLGFIVNGGQGSSSSEDGGIRPPKDLTDAEKNKWKQGWQPGQGTKKGKSGDKKGKAAGEVTGGDTDDADAGDSRDDNNDDRNTDRRRRSRVITLTQAQIERALLRNELRDMLELDSFAALDDYMTRNQDAQDGFVMYDLHKNRVRIAQHIMRPDKNDPNDTTVRMYALNYRGTSELKGISTMEYRVRFNKKPPEDPKEFRSLPWPAYFSTRSFDSTQWAGGEGQLVQVPNSNDDTILAVIFPDGYDSKNPPEYWPLEFGVQCTNPHGDFFRVVERYENMDSKDADDDADNNYYRNYTDSNGGADQSWIQLQQGDTMFQVAKAGEIFFDSKDVGIGKGFLWNPIEDYYNSNNEQEPWKEGENPTRPVDLGDAYQNTQNGMVVLLNWKFYIIDFKGNRLPYDYSYADPYPNHDPDNLYKDKFSIYSVRDVISGARLGNVEVVFDSTEEDEKNGSQSLLNGPIDVVIPQGNEHADYPGVYRHYDNYRDDDDGGGGAEVE